MRDGRHVVVLTGAGVSVASGLPTYRGLGGLWTKDPSLAEALVAGADPKLMWRALASLRTVLAGAEPNPAHHALAAWEKRVVEAGGTFTLVTQNVDGLHQRAGSRNVVEYHGALRRSRCNDPSCTLEPFEDGVAGEAPPPCPRCGGPLRPDVVLFEEMIGAHEEMTAKRALRDCDLFLAAGTSGTVWPAASFVRGAKYAGAHTVLVNLERLDDDVWDEQHLGPAEALLPRLVAGGGG